MLYQKVHLTPSPALSWFIVCFHSFLVIFVKSMSVDVLSKVCKKWRKGLFPGVFSQLDIHFKRTEVQLLYQLL